MADLRLAPVAALVPAALVVMFAFPALLPSAPAAQGHAASALVKARVVAPDHVRLQFDGPLARTDAANFRFTEGSAPDAPVPVTQVQAGGDGSVTLTVAQALRASERYHIEVTDPPVSRDVAPSTWAILLTVFLSSALINNFVFTRYLGLCIFFGVSKRTETAVGMGITFTAVMLFTALSSWAIDTYVLQPLHLGFLQVLVFIGTVAAVVQFLDTMLKKTHPALHKSFGVYLMLITTNCVILAVPLLNAGSHAPFLEALALAIGSGLGFALALFLMSTAREKLELARVPKSFEGLPIAFALAGLFALAFMGFSGLDFFR
jgi:Na+-translocating ferredoxin:NAD+ oxidoreductase subunit A